jgi:hypothetical protein
MEGSALRGTERASHDLLRPSRSPGSLPGGDDAALTGLLVRSGRVSGAGRTWSDDRDAVREQIRWVHHARAVRRARRLGRSI